MQSSTFVILLNFCASPAFGNIQNVGDNAYRNPTQHEGFFLTQIVIGENASSKQMKQYPKIKDPDLVSEYPRVVNAGGGYVWDDVSD